MNVHFSSKTPEWATPQDFFDDLNREFDFTLDPCATAENAKCSKYFTKEQDGLAQDWSNERVFCNPPYGRVIGDWVKKCATGGGETIRHAYPRQNRYKMVARIYPRESRSSIYQRTSEVWRIKELCPIS